MKGMIYWIPTDEECEKCIKECNGNSTPACVECDGKCTKYTGYKTNDKDN